MGATGKIFLGKLGKIHGPFTPDALEALRKNGEIHGYSYIWDAQARVWNPLEAPPPSPDGEPEKGRGSSVQWTTLEAICHDYVNIVSGSIESVTETGCELVSRDTADAPRLATRGQLILNLMDAGHHKSLNVLTHLSEVSRKDGHWIYSLRWERKPTF